MFVKKIQKDERVISVENNSYKYGYAIFSFGLLFDILYRSSMRNEAPWDLFVLLGIAGFVVTAYQYKHKIFTTEWKRQYLLLIIISAVLAIATTLILKFFG